MLTGLTEHPLTTLTAQRLEAERHEAYLSVAADLLGLSDHEAAIVSAGLAEKAARAIVLQANALIERGTEADVYSKESVDSLSRDYRDDVILPYAAMLATEVLGAIGVLADAMGDGFGVIRTRR